MNIESKLLTIITLVLSTSANSALLSRLGGLAYYDTEADLTWLADANYSATQYVNSGGTEGDADGRMNWANANAWAADLNVAGVAGWRVANTVDIGNDGCNYSTTGGTDCGYNVDPTTGEMANLLGNVLGNLPYYDTNGIAAQPGWGLTDTGPFSNIMTAYYWSATQYATDANQAWVFSTFYSDQNHGIKSSNLFAWAVQSGDVSAVPVPATVWLFGSGLIGLLGVAKRKKA